MDTRMHIKAFVIVLLHVFSLGKSFDVTGKNETVKSQVNKTVCSFDILNLEDVMSSFDAKSQIDDDWMIMFHINIPDSFFSNKFRENDLEREQHQNGLTRWIWILEKHKNLLTYPVNFEALTFQLAAKVETTIQVDVNVSLETSSNDNNNNYLVCSEAVFNVLLLHVLNGTENNWVFCHRYFKDQSHKDALFTFTGTWLGYDYKCYDKFRNDEKNAVVIKKGAVNYVITIFVNICSFYIYLLLLLLPYRYDPKQASIISIEYYKNGETPYSFDRFLLSFQSKFNNWMYLPEILLFLLYSSTSLILFFVSDIIMEKTIPDYKKFESIYSGTYFITDIWSKAFFVVMYFLFVGLLLVSFIAFTLSENVSCIIPSGGGISKFTVSDITRKDYVGYTKYAFYFLDRISAFFSTKLWKGNDNEYPGCNCCNCCKCWGYFCKVIIGFFNTIIGIVLLLTPIGIFLNIAIFFHKKDISEIHMFRWIKDISSTKCYQCIKNVLPLKNCISWYIVYFIFCAYLFLTIISPGLPNFDFATKFILRTLIYLLFVAGPILSTSTSVFKWWPVVMLIIAYLLKYSWTFHSEFRKLLSKLIELKEKVIEEKKKESKEKSNTATESDQEQQNVQTTKQQNQQRKTTNNEIRNHNITTIPVTFFDAIVKKYFSLQRQIMILAIKSVLTIMFLYVAFDSLKKTSGKFDFGLLFSAILPALAEKFLSPRSIEDEFLLHKEEIKIALERQLVVFQIFPLSCDKQFLSTTNEENTEFIKDKGDKISAHEKCTLYFPLCLCLYYLPFVSHCTCKRCDDNNDVDVDDDHHHHHEYFEI